MIDQKRKVSSLPFKIKKEALVNEGMIRKEWDIAAALAPSANAKQLEVFELMVQEHL